MENLTMKCVAIEMPSSFEQFKENRPWSSLKMKQMKRGNIIIDNFYFYCVCIKMVFLFWSFISQIHGNIVILKRGK